MQINPDNMNSGKTGPKHAPRHAAPAHVSQNQNVPAHAVPGNNTPGHTAQNNAVANHAAPSHAAPSQQPQVYAAPASQSAVQGSAAKVKKQKRKITPSLVIFRIASVVFVVSLLALGAIGLQYWLQDKEYQDMQAYAHLSDKENISLDELTVDWEALQAINPDIVAWIYVPDTKINYPVVQGKDNFEYLHKAFNKDEGWLSSAGTIFLDVKNQADFSDRNSALYGHHMKDGSMFACLTDWADSETFNKHRNIYILTPRGNYLLTTFAVVKSTGSESIVETTFSAKEDYTAYIQDKFNRSVVQQEGKVLDVKDVYQSVLLSTCEYTQADGRMVVYASVTESTVKSTLYLLESHQKSMGTGLNSSQAKEVGQLN